jgi:hypothetical protein
MTNTQIEELVEALRKLADVDPGYADEYNGSIWCFWCPKWLDHESHAPDCPWVEAKALLARLEKEEIK